jgi:hypothetical protein
MTNSNDDNFGDIFGSLIGKFTIYISINLALAVAVGYAVYLSRFGPGFNFVNGSAWIAFIGHSVNFIYYYVSWDHAVVLPVLYIAIALSVFVALGLF